MPIGQLVSNFDKANRPLFIEVKEIGDYVLGLVNNHEIYYCKQPLSDGPIVGMLEQLEYPLAWGDGETGVINYIHFSENLPQDLQRIIICKELIHILDPDLYLTRTETHVDTLTIDLSTRSAVRGDGPHAKHDRNAIVLAMAIFLPFSIRNTLMPQYKAGVLTAEILADEIQIPVDLVRYIMSDNWPDHINEVLENLSDSDG